MSPFTSAAGRAKLLAKNRQTFILQTTKLTRIARRVCQDILQPRRAARRPYASINANAVKAECEWRGEGHRRGVGRGTGVGCSLCILSAGVLISSFTKER